MNESTKMFQELTRKLDDFVAQTEIEEIVRKEFLKRVSNAKRIFTTGTGTSLPTAKYCAARLQQFFPDTPIHFLPNAEAIRACDTLQIDDLFVIISYGLNRADSLIIVNKACARCPTVTISGNSEAQFPGNLSVVIPPKKEKIFCRPASPLTTLIAIEQLLGQETASVHPLNVARSLVSWVDPTKQTVVLYAADARFGAELWSIVLREGAGMNISLRDMENYSHGYYGNDTAHLNERQFIIITTDSPDDTRDYERASGLYGIQGFEKFHVTAPGNVCDANASLFREAPEVVSLLLEKTGYDMYGPNGMDANRKYHEYEHFHNY